MKLAEYSSGLVVMEDSSGAYWLNPANLGPISLFIDKNRISGNHNAILGVAVKHKP